MADAAPSARLGRLARHLSSEPSGAPTPTRSIPTSGSKKPMGFGIIGAGSIAASSFAPALAHSSLASLVAVSRRDLAKAQEFAEGYEGCAAYDDPEQLLADSRVDAVVIATPGDSHCEYTLAAARHGKHVLVEKPMAVDSAECRTMIDACAAAKVGLAVAYRRRTWPQVLKAQELIAAGAIGQVVCARTHYSGGQGFSGWQLDPTAGGTMLEMAVHRIEVLLNLASPARPTVVSALVEQVLPREDGATIDDTDALLLRFDSGIVGVHSTIMTSPPRRDAVQIDGTKGRVIIESLESGSTEIKLETEAGGVETIALTPLEGNLFDQPMIDDFIASIAEGREPICVSAAAPFASSCEVSKMRLHRTA